MHWGEELQISDICGEQMSNIDCMTVTVVIE